MKEIKVSFGKVYFLCLFYVEPIQIDFVCFWLLGKAHMVEKVIKR